MPTVIFSWTHYQNAWARCAGGVPSPWSQQTGLSLQDRPDHIRDTEVTRKSSVLCHPSQGRESLLSSWVADQQFFGWPRQHPVNSFQGCLGVWKDGSQGLPLTGSSGPCWWKWGSAKLFLGVTVPKNSPSPMDHMARVKRVSHNKQKPWWTLDLMPSPWSSLCWSP